MALDESISVAPEHGAPRPAEGSAIFDVDLLNDTRWDTLTTGSTAALFSSRRWLGVLHDVYGFSFRARLKLVNEVEVAGFGYAELDGPRGARIVSLPFCDFNDPPVNDEQTWSELTSGLVLGERPITIRTRDHHIAAADTRLTSATVGVAHQLDSSVDPEEAFASFATLPKRMIRRAAADGLRTEISTSRDSVRDFFDLHLHVRKYRHGLLAQPFDLFEQIAHAYFDRDMGFIAGSWVDDVFVGGCLVLVEGDTAYYKFSASHPDFRRSGVSHVTLFEGFREAHRRGLVRYDLGRSDLDPPGLVDFKRRFRPDEQFVTTHSAAGTLPAAATESGSNLSATLGELTELFVRSDVPDDVTERAGRLLYGFFA